MIIYDVGVELYTYIAMYSVPSQVKGLKYLK